MSKQVQIDEATLIRQTVNAGLFEINGEEHWIPWSQVDGDCDLEDDGDTGPLIITQWIAEQKDLEWDSEV